MPHRLCAPSSVRLLLAAVSLMTVPLLLPRTAHAGTYWRSFSGTGQDEVTTPTSHKITAYANDDTFLYYFPYYYRNGKGISDGTPGSAATATETFSGSVTVTFTWHPNPNLASDPAPQTVLVRQDCTVQFYIAPQQVGSAVGDSSGRVDSGLGVSAVESSSGELVTCTGTDYVIAGGNTFSVGCSPSMSVFLSRSSSGAGGSINSKLAYTAAAYPIVISAPEPLGRPDLGDGKNQFVYGAQQPDGYLYVPGALRAVGASSADMQWLLASGSVDMAIDNSVIPYTFVHGWTVSGDTLFINTPNNSYPNYQFNSWVFKGLPFQNSSFGNHDVNLYVQNTKAQTAKIQTFYSATASNYPESPGEYDINGYYTPNWYNYYKEAYPTSTSYDANMTGPEGETNPTAAGMAWVAGPPDGKGGVKIEVEVTKMGPGAISAPAVRTIPVFEVSPMTNYLDVAGQLQIKGIYSYLYVDGHETTHVASYVSGDAIPRNSDGTLPQGIVDSDGDFIPDQIELKYHLNPHDTDTTGYFTDVSNFSEGTYTNRGDEEAIAAIGGLHAVVSNSTAWQQDWADISVRYGARATYFPYEFVPSNAAAPHTNSVPSSAVTVLP